MLFHIIYNNKLYSTFESIPKREYLKIEKPLIDN